MTDQDDYFKRNTVAKAIRYGTCGGANCPPQLAREEMSEMLREIEGIRTMLARDGILTHLTIGHSGNTSTCVLVLGDPQDSDHARALVEQYVWENRWTLNYVCT